MILVLSGSILSFILLIYIYYRTPKENRCNASEAIAIICLGSLMSWLCILMLIITEIINKNDK